MPLAASLTSPFLPSFDRLLSFRFSSRTSRTLALDLTYPLPSAYLDRGLHDLKVLSRAGEGPAGADSRDERVYLPGGLGPQLGARRLAVDLLYRIASDRVAFFASDRIVSYRVASYRAVSHRHHAVSYLVGKPNVIRGEEAVDLSRSIDPISQPIVSRRYTAVAERPLLVLPAKIHG